MFVKLFRYFASARGKRALLAFAMSTVVGCGGGGSENPATGASPSNSNGGTTSSGSSTASNSPPTIEISTGSSIVVGSELSIEPVASDPDGDSLTFSIVNLPTWAAFDTSSGKISGVPGAGDIGNYQDIVVSTSDGTVTVDAEPFSVNVIAQGNGSLVINWRSPTRNMDGSALDDLAGFNIYLGNQQDRLDRKVAINGVGLTTYVIEGLQRGDWYVAMTAVDSQGREGALSQIVRKSAT